MAGTLEASAKQAKIRPHIQWNADRSLRSRFRLGPREGRPVARPGHRAANLID